MSPSSGGMEGGTFLHIHGTGLDDTTDAETQVLVGGMWFVFVNCINCPAITVCNSCNRSKHCFKEVHEYSYSLINGKTCMHVCT